MMDTDLLPCPHCGSAAKSYHRPDDTGWSNTDWVCCENEDCGAGTCLHEARDVAVTCWNRRDNVQHQSPDDRIDSAVRKLRILKRDFNMQGANATTMERAIDLLRSLRAAG